MNASPTLSGSPASLHAVAKPGGYYANERRELLELVPATANHILEVGCGEGAMGGRLKQSRRPASVEVVGIEISAAAAAIARTRLDSVHVGDVEEIELPYRDYFDCLIFADVLEHLRDPWQTLIKFSRFLRPGGCVVASIPNVQNARVLASLLRGRFDYKPDGIMDSTHLRFFTRKSVIELFSTTGYRVRSVVPFMWRKPLRTFNKFTAGIFSGFLAFQHYVVAERPN